MTQQSLITRLKTAEEALDKIADLYGAWGPFPEKNELWRSMAVVTSREALTKIKEAS